MVRELAAEAGRRRLEAALPALQALCRRFKGFGRHAAASEQRAALEAFAAIGGPAARIALQTLMREDVFPPPALHWVARAAARLGCRLPVAAALQLLRDPEPEVRADAAACAPVSSETTKVLTELLRDHSAAVAEAAACALARMGRPEARPVLLRILEGDPTEEAIEAATFVPNETIIVMLGRIARGGPALAPAAMAALREIEDARAARLISVLEAELDTQAGDHTVPAHRRRA